MDSVFDPDVSAQLLLFAEQTADFVGVSDPWGRILYLNPAARKRLGVADLTDLTVADFFPAEAITLYYELIRPQLLRTGAWSGEVPVNVAGGVAVPMYISTSARLGPGGETNGSVVYAHELSRPDPQGVIAAADVDDVTGLPGPSVFEDRVRLAVSAAHRDGETCAFVLVEIAGMADVIDSFGELAAERVMRSLAGRMLRLARTIDVAGRVGEHRLGLLLRSVRGRGEALRIAQNVHDSLVDPPVATAGGEVVASLGCGVAFSDPGDDLATLVDRASAAMSYEPALPEARPNAPTSGTARPGPSVTIDEFRVGISRGDVRAYAEPVIDLVTGRLAGYRGLARWQHRRLGPLDAAAFVDMIADTPLANQVDLLIARETAAVLAVAASSAPLRLYIPASPRLILDVRTEQYLTEITNAFFLTNNQVRLQVARRFLEHAPPSFRDALRSLRDSDIALVLTGVESASEARDLVTHGFAELHISRWLTGSAATDPDARRTITEIVHLAHRDGVTVAARGVNDDRARAAVFEAGCDLATGRYYGGPEPTDSID